MGRDNRFVGSSEHPDYSAITAESPLNKNRHRPGGFFCFCAGADTMQWMRPLRKRFTLTFLFIHSVVCNRHKNAARSGLVSLAGSILWVLLLTSCGQVITRPTATPVPPTPTLVITAAVTQRPTATPAPYTPEPTFTPTVTPTPVIYAIQRGDTLGAVAARFGITVATLQETNGIADPRSLRIGQELIIPAPAAAVEPGVTPTLTPIPVTYTVENLYFAEIPRGGLYVLGEVVNPGDQPLEQVEISIDLRDSTNQVLATTQGGIVTDYIEAGARGPFAVLFANAPQAFASYVVQPLRGLPGYLGNYYRDLVIRDATGSSEQVGSYVVTGQVVNTGPEDAVEVSLVVVVYDGLGRVIGVRRAEPAHNVIPRGGHTDFTIEVVPAAGPVARFMIIPQARRVPAVPAP